MTDFSTSQPATPEERARLKRIILIGLAIVAVLALILALSSCDGNDEPAPPPEITVVDDSESIENAVNAADEAGANASRP